MLSNYFKYNAGTSANYTIKNGNTFAVQIKYTEIETRDAFKTWLSTHNTIAYYVKATPTYTPIEDTTIAQLENVLKMHTNKNVTNAWIEPTGTNAQAGLTLTYYRDLQTITDKIDSLEARVTLLE